MGLQMKLKSANFNLLCCGFQFIMDRASDRILCVGLLRRFGFALNAGLPFGHVPLWGHKRKDVRATVARTSRAAVSRTYRVPHHEHLALRWHALSRYGGTHSRATAARTLALRRHEQSALRRHDSHLAYRITHISRYGGTHSRAAISRMSALWKHKCSCHRSADILSKARAIVANPARYFTRDNWPGNCDDGQYEPSKIFYVRQMAGQLSRQTIQTQQDILRETISRAIVTTVNTNPARYFTRDNYPGNCHDGQYEPSKIFYARQLPSQLL